jgi:hypothetical protein
MTREIREQILEIRDTGLTNMFDVNRVQRLAFDRGFYELVNFIEEGRENYCAEYVRFILNGVE